MIASQIRRPSARSRPIWSVPGTIILLYHRVADWETDPQLLCVTPSHFNEHLKVLRKHAPAIHLKDLASTLRDGTPPRRAAVITFDDGYADNLINAKPILQRHNSPATVFIATGQIGQSCEFWWDELERLLLRPGTRDGQLNRRWNVERPDDPSPSHSLYRSLCDRLRPLSAPERSAAIKQIRVESGSDPNGRSTHRALSANEVSQLATDHLIDIGAHTVSHPFLSAQSLNDQRNEVEQSKAVLEQVLCRPVTSFSYPFGYRAAYTSQTVELVRQAGYHCACSNFGGLVYNDTDTFQLPRFLVRDWDGDEFARRLHMFLLRRARCRGTALVH